VATVLNFNEQEIRMGSSNGRCKPYISNVNIIKSQKYFFLTNTRPTVMKHATRVDEVSSYLALFFQIAV